MSDLFGVREKTVEGDEWRGTVRLTLDGVEHELSVRQLRDPEFFRVMKRIDRDELKSLREELPDDLMEEYRELQEEEDLSDEERERLSEIEEELNQETTSLFDALSEETFQGIVECAYYGVEPDNDDLRKALFEYADEIKEEYGVEPKTDKDEVVHQFVKEKIIQEDILDRSTGFQSFIIGMQVLIETVGAQGN